MGAYVRYFLGTPQRTMRTLVGVGIVLAAVRPDILHQALARLIAGVEPLVAPLLAIVIAFAGIRMILRAGRK